uniref:Uncharacterized protein n=1 Tax=Oryza sativa subsp. japonica TaxID=39947 RepID=Q5VQ39_ORYSJ|nr:hypothetical protein [Oryza sativa Japonica Group]
MRTNLCLLNWPDLGLRNGIFYASSITLGASRGTRSKFWSPILPTKSLKKLAPVTGKRGESRKLRAVAINGERRRAEERGDATSRSRRPRLDPASAGLGCSAAAPLAPTPSSSPRRQARHHPPLHAADLVAVRAAELHAGELRELCAAGEDELPPSRSTPEGGRGAPADEEVGRGGGGGGGGGEHETHDDITIVAAPTETLSGRRSPVATRVATGQRDAKRKDGAGDHAGGGVAC